MEFRIKVLFFFAMILNLSTEIYGSRESEIAKAKIKRAIMEKIRNGEKVNQGHINELADLQSAILRGKVYENCLGDPFTLPETEDLLNGMGLSPYGRVYDEMRLHGSHNWETHRQKIRQEIEEKQMAGEKINQNHFNELAIRETTKLRNQEYRNLLADGYPPKLATRLIYERGLVGQGEVYDKLREPHINFRTGSALSMDLTIPKRNVIADVEDERKNGQEITQNVIDRCARFQAGDLRERLYLKMINVGLDHGTAYELANDRGFQEQNEVYQELRKPPIIAEEQVSSKGKKRLQPGEGSSSGRKHQSARKRSTPNK